MAKGARRKGANIFVWIILILLIVGLAGFGTGGLGGQTRNIGSVGDRDISVNEYARALQQEIRAFEAQVGQAVGFQQALALGVDRGVRERLVTLAALDNETGRLGISVGDGAVRDELLGTPAFRGLDGGFDRSAYRFALQQAGLSETEFEEQIRRDIARDILQGAVLGSVSAPEAYTALLMDYITERRSLVHLRLAPGDLEADVPQPDDAALASYYEANASAYTRPETRQITYALLTPEMMLDRVEVDEAMLRTAYEQRLSEFVQPERRLVERLVFGTEEEAAEAMSRLAADEEQFDAIVEERGLALLDIDMGDVTEAELGAAGAEVFALDGPGVAGPLPSEFGPAIYRVNAILSAQEITFEEAQEILRDELALDAARRAITALVEDADDLLAGGATLEELAEETGMELGQIAMTAETTEGIAGYGTVREAARDMQPGDFPEVLVLEDGGIAALRIDELAPATQPPLDEVRDQVVAGWQRQETLRLLAEQAETMRAAVAEGATLQSFGYPVQIIESASRDGFIEGFPRSLLDDVFTMEPGETRVLASDEAVHLVRLERVQQAVLAQAELNGLRNAVVTELSQGMARDVFDLFASALISEAGIRLNETAINAVHAQFR
ncbi:peptidyl-prolyl cis-trans isomerase [Plastorhodobacter daqingensis]|uniref:Peptidyl-prolyl cis-trans isomerase n=1 Tax=Plastorhodobacter daqingensis TaxID=1387281 RepID=A0ABW2UIV4_9RHOB